MATRKKILNQQAYCKRHVRGAAQVYFQCGQSRERMRNRRKLLGIIDQLTAQGKAFRGVWLSPKQFCVEQY